MPGGQKGTAAPDGFIELKKSPAIGGAFMDLC